MNNHLHQHGRDKAAHGHRHHGHCDQLRSSNPRSLTGCCAAETVIEFLIFQHSLSNLNTHVRLRSNSLLNLVQSPSENGTGRRLQGIEPWHGKYAAEK